MLLPRSVLQKLGIYQNIKVTKRLVRIDIFRGGTTNFSSAIFDFSDIYTKYFKS